MKNPSKQQRAKWDALNRAVALIILGAPERHPRFMRDWATTVIARLDEGSTGQRALFATAAASPVPIGPPLDKSDCRAARE